MLKKLAPIFLLVLIGGLLFPLISLADGEYSILFYNDKDKDGHYDPDPSKDGAVLPVDTKTVKYDGFVPCGKCLSAPTGTFLPLKDADKSATDDRCYGGTAPTGGYDQVYLHCQLCHVFVMINDIVAFLLTTIIPPLAVLMLIIGGVMFYFGGAKPDLIVRGRKLIISVIIGLFLIYGAYMIIGILLSIAGAANMEAVSNIYKNGVFSIDCPIVIPK